MLFEQRMYTLASEPADRFWALQYERGFELVRPIMERLVGYFSTRIGSQDVIVHWWRYDSFEDWRQRLHGLYEVDALRPYFKKVRAILSAQENKLLTFAPLQALTPIWSPTSDWLPGQTPFRAGPLSTALCVDMEVLQLHPGTLPSYWQAWQSMDPEVLQTVQQRLIGCFHTWVGSLHEVTILRWHPDQQAVQNWSSSLAGRPGWVTFQAEIAPLVSHTCHHLLRPGPHPQLSPLFS
jgi:NIPSNAP